jgi:hypothetical protein
VFYGYKYDAPMGLTGGKMQLASNYLNPDILQSLHYSSIEEAGLDMLLLSAHAKYSEYLTENRQFEKKYQTDFFSFQKMINQQISKSAKRILNRKMI